MPYSVYPELDFDVPLGSGEWGTIGDAMDRYMMRIREMVQSSRILRQALKQIPDGAVLAKVVRNFKPAPGECQIRVESARGDRDGTSVSDGSGVSVAGACAYRLLCRDGNDPEAQPGTDDCRPGGADREPRRYRAGDRSLERHYACRVGSTV